MKRLIPVLLALLFAASCSHPEGRVIPERTFSKIYADMALADIWIAHHPEYMTQADTSMVYEFVFREYGYSTKDYLKSVEHYVAKPDKLCYIVERAKDRLEKKAQEYKAIERKLNQQQLENARKDSLQMKKADD